MNQQELTKECIIPVNRKKTYVLHGLYQNPKSYTSIGATSRV